MFRLLITTMNCGIPVGSVIEHFDSMQEMQAAERALDQSNERWQLSADYRKERELYYYCELS
jgi:hypothetical protein